MVRSLLKEKQKNKKGMREVWKKAGVDILIAVVWGKEGDTVEMNGENPWIKEQDR
jgi:hypothetical protein